MKPNWTIAPTAPAEFFQEIPDLPPLCAQLLWNRSIRTAVEVEKFLHPNLEQDLHDPFLFHDMQKAVERISHAFDKKEKIAIWGDYDCDGVCGTAILFTLFCDLGYENLINIHIPDRNKEGYGLTMPHLEELAAEGITLLITVDCGITDRAEITWSQEQGIDVIIADHHSVPEILPPAYAILNPKDPRSGYPFGGLAGTGVALKLACALIIHDSRFNIHDFLDLVALATLADSMPLRDENRTLVTFGLEALAKTERLGLRTLLNFCELQNGFSVRDIHFSLIPRINAMGRMEHASTSFRLLTSTDPDEIAMLIRHMDTENQRRKFVVDLITREVLDRVQARPALPGLVFEVSESWTPGVLGLAAQRIMSEVGRPVVLTVTNPETGRVMGNARALGTFNIVKVLHSRPELFTDAGGHPYAGGFSTTVEHLEEVRSLFVDAGAAMEAADGFSAHNQITVDAELSGTDTTQDTFGQVQALAPFGQENEEPQFLLRHLLIVTLRAVGNGAKHLKLRLKLASANFIDAIAFGFGDAAKTLSPGNEIDVVAKLSENNWNGRKSLELQITDLDHNHQ